MYKSKILSLSVSFLFVIILAGLCFAFSACGNKTDISVSVTQICDGKTGEYASILGDGTYQSGKNVSIQYSDIATGYYFYAWRVGGKEYTNTKLDFLSFTSDTEIVAIFGKGAEITIDKNRIMAKHGTLTTTQDSVSIKLDDTIAEGEFSYWKVTYLGNKVSEIYSVDSEFLYSKSKIGSSMIFEPVCANCGAVAVYYESDSNDVHTLSIRGWEVYSYSDFQTTVTANTSIKYVFWLETYATGSADADYLSTNITGNIQSGSNNITVNINMTKSYASLAVGKVFWDEQGNQRCALLGGLGPVENSESLTNHLENVIIANKPDGTSPTVEEVSLTINATRTTVN